MTLEEARDTWFKYKKVGTAVFYLFTERKGYNRTDYSAMRIFGTPATEEEMHEVFGGSPYCGGISYNGKKQEECDYGERFSFVVWGCD